jgi:endonuclease-8
MPEGHTVHRTANQFNELFAGKALTIDSPQGRFGAGAARVSGKILIGAQALGKQLFLEFDEGLFVRIHLGIYGKWRWYRGKHLAKALQNEPIGQVRARFYTDEAMADLRGPTVCEVIVAEEIARVQDQLGPDPLNDDLTGSELARFVARVQRSKQPIGVLLMDQSVISGVGNVYRAELLFRAGINPYVEGNRLTGEQLRSIWKDAVALMRVGVATGFMITRDELFETGPSKSERNFVYKREGEPCRICGHNVSIALMQARKLYWCGKCQP